MSEGLLVLAAGVNLVGIGSKASRIDFAKVNMWLAIHDPVGQLGAESPTHQQPAGEAFGEPEIPFAPGRAT